MNELTVNDCRPEVLKFAIEMEKELLKNDWKGGWQLMNDHQLIARVEEEVHELKDVLRYNIGDKKSVLKEAIDVANFAMFIADNFGSK